MKGSFTEELINSTIDWYLNQNIAFFQKSHIPISVNYRKSFYVNASLRAKADVDYYGVYKGKYIAFEVKETSKDYFLMSNVKEHQRIFLFKLLDFSAISFLVINFLSDNDSAYLITSEVLKNLWLSNKTRITKEEAHKLGSHIPLKFPGILDFLSCLDGQNFS